MDSKWPTKFHKDCILDFFVVILLLRHLLDKKKKFQNSIRAHAGHRAYETLQSELYHVVDYDGKWSTKFHKDGIWIFFISLLRRIFFFFFFQNSIRAHAGHRAYETLQID